MPNEAAACETNQVLTPSMLGWSMACNATPWVPRAGLAAAWARMSVIWQKGWVLWRPALSPALTPTLSREREREQEACLRTAPVGAVTPSPLGGESLPPA